MKVIPRTSEQLKLMRKSGQITAKALKKVLESVKPGISLIELDQIAEKEILKLDGKPSFKTVPGYRWTTCLTINHEVVHGIPREIKLKEGDLFSVDIGTVYKGWHTDAAWSVVVGGGKSTFLDMGEQALWDGIAQAKSGNRVGDISNAIQIVIEKGGGNVVRSLVGHGVGRNLHEEPEVPGFGKPGQGIKLLEDVTLAIEAIYTSGSYEVGLDTDGWTISTIDGSMGGLFEMSVIVGKEKAEVLTDWRMV